MTQISAFDLGLFIKHTLRDVYLDHISLGDEGQITRDALNQFGELALVADYQAEEIIIERVCVFARRNHLTIKIISEEHHDLITGEGSTPDYIVYIDGLDGSSVYAAATRTQLQFRTSYAPYDRRPRYGTMIGIVDASNRYSGVQAAGILEPMTNRVIIAAKGGGVYVAHPTQVGNGRRVHTNKEWSPTGLIYCDSASPANQTMFAGPLMATYELQTVSAGSAARYYFDVAIGRALASCEWTRKRCLEVVVGYLIVREAGGVMINLAAIDLGNYRIDRWGYDFTEHFIAAGSGEIADHILEAVMSALAGSH